MRGRRPTIPVASACPHGESLTIWRRNGALAWLGACVLIALSALGPGPFGLGIANAQATAGTMLLAADGRGGGCGTALPAPNLYRINPADGTGTTIGPLNDGVVTNI